MGMAGTRRTVWGGATLLGGAFVMISVASAWFRDPWLDELITLYLVEDLARYVGDPHPVAYYLILAPIQLATTEVAWLRISGLVFTAALAAATCLPLVPDRRAWGRMLAVVCPSVAGTAIAISYMADLRMYGPLTIAAVIISTTLHTWAPPPELQRPHRWALAGCVTLLAILHVWGALLAIGYIIAIRLKVPRVTATQWLAPLVTSGAIVALSYAWGPLQVPNPASRLDVDPSSYTLWFIGGFSTHLPVAALMIGAWGASLLAPGRSSKLFFDLPAATALASALVVSFWVPLAKPYTLMPALVLLIAGALVRTSRHVVAHAVLLTLLAANLVLHAPGVLSERMDWGTSTRTLTAMASDSTCPIWAWPDGHYRVSTQPLVDGLEVVPFGEADDCACERRWVVINHLTQDVREPPFLKDVTVEATWPTAVIGTIPCA